MPTSPEALDFTTGKGGASFGAEPDRKGERLYATITPSLTVGLLHRFVSTSTQHKVAPTEAPNTSVVMWAKYM